MSVVRVVSRRLEGGNRFLGSFYVLYGYVCDSHKLKIFFVGSAKPFTCQMFCRKHESQKFNANKCRSSASFRDDWKAAIDSLVVSTYCMVMYATHLTENIFCL